MQVREDAAGRPADSLVSLQCSCRYPTFCCPFFGYYHVLKEKSLIKIPGSELTINSQEEDYRILRELAVLPFQRERGELKRFREEQHITRNTGELPSSWKSWMWMHGFSWPACTDLSQGLLRCTAQSIESKEATSA